MYKSYYSPGDYVVMQPVEEANPINVAWDPFLSSMFNFQVNNTGGSASPTNMIPTNYTNAVSTPCNYVSDTSLVAWADFDGTNYNIWYKRSGYDWAGTGHYYRPAPFEPGYKATEDITVIPNPATNTLTLNAEGSYHIANMLGQVVLKGDLYAGSHDIDVQALPQGNYIITFVRHDGQSLKRKFTKN